jgi:hypothetical protein
VISSADVLRPGGDIGGTWPAWWLGLLAMVVAGCADPVPPSLRPEPIAWADTLPIPEPEARDPIEVPKIMKDAMAGEMSRVITIRNLAGEQHEALNVTRWDDVVPSAWFEHRNAAHPLTPAQVEVGPTVGNGPDTTGALEIISAKVQGVSPGFNIRDARGDRYVVKFDPKGFLHMSSAAGVISNRLLHAAGYHVPEDFVFVFSKSKLAVAEGATIRGEDFEERPLTLDVAFDVLAMTDTLPDGRYLAVSSKFVPGPPKGPFFFDGVRDDDPNDWYHHEYRRELRGLYVVSSWINHVDMRFMNTMDAYVPPGYLKHYLIDFAASLGSGTTRPHEPREGTEYNVDLWPSLGRVFSLGFYRVGWEGREWEVIDPTIGWLEAEEFDPAGWKPNWPNRAFQLATDRDGYWGAKLVGSFTDEQILAAVRAGRLPTARATDTLAKILMVRRDRVVDHWYRKVSPLENLSVVPQSATGAEENVLPVIVRFDDLGLRKGLWRADEIGYRWTLEHEALRRDWRGRGAAEAGDGRQRIVLGPGDRDPGERPSDDAPTGPDAIAKLEIEVEHLTGGERQPAVTVWLEWDASAGRYRVAGLEH